MRRSGRGLPVPRTLVLLFSALVIGGCTEGSSGVDADAEVATGASPEPVPDRSVSTLRVGIGRDPRSIHPRSVSDDEGEFIVRALFDGLVDVSPEGTVVAAGAQHWSIEDDGLTYRFLLRDARFHDGTAVTASHYADAILAVFDPDRPPFFREGSLRSLRGAVLDEHAPGDDAAGEPASEVSDDGRVSTDRIVAAGGVEVVSARELVLRLERSDPLLLHRLADPMLVPLPAAADEDPEAFAREPIGNGPFRMAGPREPGAFVRLRAYREHHAPPEVDELLIQVYADDVDRSQRWADLLAGRLQVTAVPVERRAEARQRFGEPLLAGIGPGLHDLPLASLYAYGFVLDVEPYDDLDLRRAISAAIDRERLARELSAAGVEPADAILPPSVGGPVPDCPHCRYDPLLAAELVGAWRDRVGADGVEPSIVLAYPRGGGHVTVAESIASDLEVTLGLDVRLRSLEFGELIRAVVDGEAPLFRYGLRAALGGEVASWSLLEPGLSTGGESNWIRWSDTETDRVFSTWTSGVPPDLLRQVEAEVLGQAAIVPLLWTRQDLVVVPEVIGFRTDTSTGRWWPELVQLR